MSSILASRLINFSSHDLSLPLISRLNSLVFFDPILFRQLFAQLALSGDKVSKEELEVGGS